MLTPPSKGFALSVNSHNVQLDAMAEWLEGCITFIDKEITKIAVKDILLEEGYYREQDFAQERIDDAWKELQRREKALGPAATFKVEAKRLNRACKWEDSPAYSFCLMLAMQAAYRPSFHKKFGSNYTEQGALFERLTTEALKKIGLSTHSAGWSHLASNSVSDKVEAVGKHLGEPHYPGAVGKWTARNAKDCGLDVVCHLPFPDGYAGRPVLFVQCASGENWEDKCHTPSIQQWGKLIELATMPTRGIAHPFVLMEPDFRRTANLEYLSLVLDRHRLSRPGPVTTANWIPSDLAKLTNQWTEKRLVALEANKS
jgi:hypothetical protein